MLSEASAAITLAICTRNRSERLERCLESALSQECPVPWNVVVVDSASTDDTPATIARWKQRHPDRIVSVRLERSGTGRAREAATAATSAPIIAFTDDDCYADATYLQQVVEAFESDPDLGALGGRILLHDPADYPITICESLEPASIPPRSIVRAGFVQGASMAFRRRALVEIGGFDTRLGPGTPFCNEDVDIVGRVNAAGYPVAYLPGPTVRHHHGRRQPDEVAALIKTYDVGRGAYFVKMIVAGHLRYAKYWAWCIRQQPISTTLREIRGALHFLVVSVTTPS